MVVGTITIWYIDFRTSITGSFNVFYNSYRDFYREGKINYEKKRTEGATR